MLKEALQAGLAALAISSASCSLPDAEIQQPDCPLLRPAILTWACLQKTEATRKQINKTLQSANNSSANNE